MEPQNEALRQRGMAQARGLRERALRAALAVAREQGLRCRDPVVVRDVTNSRVHLAPAPVVARIPVTLARLRGREWFAQVVGLAAFLADAGAPVAAPARGVDPGPHVHDGLLVELWAYVEHDASRFDPAAAGRSLRALHDALTTYPEPLPGFDRLAEVERLLDGLTPSDLASEADLSMLESARSRLATEALPEGRPIHGDSHFGNILWSPGGPLWSDLENACCGPVEYDLACVTWRRRPGTDAAIAAYGEHDAELVERVTPLLALFLAAWTIVVVRRVPDPGAVAEVRRRLDRVRDWLERA